MNNDSPISRLYAYLSAGGVCDDLPSHVIKEFHPTPASRPSVTIGKRQMSQKSRANRRKASAKARRL